MGVDRAVLVVGLQALLMSGVRGYGASEAVAVHAQRALASAAALDYVLMLATDTAGARIAPDAARRAIHEGFARAVDDALILVRAIASIDDGDARAFSRQSLRTLRTAIETEALADDARSFALIALAADLAEA